MKEFINQQIQQGCNSEPMVEALKLIMNDQMHPYLLRERLDAHGMKVTDLKAESMPLVLDYIRCCLDDDVISDEELRNANALKVFFKIQEGELLERYKDQIKYLISRQLELIYADDVIDERESVAKVNLQALFDLSYDQYLQFERNAVKMVLARGGELHRLDTFYKE